jgi:FixJ family two-component response regulator
MNSRTPSVSDQPAATVYVVDDDHSMRQAIGNLVRSVGLQVRAFGSAQEFLRTEIPKTPLCLVLDVRMPDLSGLELQREELVVNHQIPIIFVTAHGDIPMSVQAMKAGAVEFLTKPFRDQDLLDAIYVAIRRSAAMIERRAVEAKLRNRYDRLTPREREVMNLVVRGLLNKQIAAELGSSELTVKTQRGQVMEKMEATSVPELVRFSQMLGLS